MAQQGRIVRRSTVLLGAVLAAGLAAAQDQRAEPARPVPPKEEVQQGGGATMDTGESLTYLGRKLWFEMRKRLNLTTEAEEKDQREAERNYRLRVGSIKVER